LGVFAKLFGIAWIGALKPRHFVEVRLAVATMSWISSSTDVKLCNVNRTLGVVASTGTFTPLTEETYMRLKVVRQ
jgi:hypothetical protein